MPQQIRQCRQARASWEGPLWNGAVVERGERGDLLAHSAFSALEGSNR